MTTTKTRTAEELARMLSGFHSMESRALHAVWKVYTEASLDRLILDFGLVSLIIVADENDDSIDITVAETVDMSSTGGVDGSNLEPWKSLIGESFGWGWVTVNQQGYCDGLLLSFGGIVPQLLINVIASSIKVGTITGTEQG